MVTPENPHRLGSYECTSFSLLRALAERRRQIIWDAARKTFPNKDVIPEAN